MVATAHTRDAWYRDRLAEARAQGRFQRISPAAALRTARRRTCMSIERFAECLGLFPAAVAAWEAGRKPVPLWAMTRLQRFAQAA